MLYVDLRMLHSFLNTCLTAVPRFVPPCAAQESPYEGGRFQLKILCSASYPYAAPQARNRCLRRSVKGMTIKNIPYKYGVVKCF